VSLYFDEEEAVEELKRRGYRVVKEDYPNAEGIDTIPKLVDYFYSRRRYYNPDRKFPNSIDYGSERKYVSSFVKSREKLGLNRKTAIQEATLIIDALFKFEKHLGLREPILDSRILAVRPIMDRICSYLNGEVAEANETDTELYIQEWNRYYNKEFAEHDFERAKQKLKKISERLDGAKERE